MGLMNKNISKELKQLGNKEYAARLQTFFKTGKGEYGEGDVFLGIVVPQQRKIAKNYTEIFLSDLQVLLNDKIHEYRLCAILILVAKYKKSGESQRKEIVEFYLKNTNNINNWDLVDLSAHYILGDFLSDKDKNILYDLSKSADLWEKRISIISTFAFIRNNQFKDTLAISEILLEDKHDLIHKAVGWMLREMGKRDQVVEEKFLNKHYKKMPRTMLRYAIEKFEENKRKSYLNRK